MPTFSQINRSPFSKKRKERAILNRSNYVVSQALKKKKKKILLGKMSYNVRFKVWNVLKDFSKSSNMFEAEM